MTILESVERAVAEGRLPEALTLALAQWRRTRSPIIADVIDSLTEQVTPIGILSARNKDAFQTEWLKAAREPDDVTVGILVAALSSRVPLETSYNAYLDRNYAKKKYGALLARVNALLKWPDDPRIAKALTALVYDADQAVTDSAAARLVYGVYLGGIAQMRDVRSVPVLSGLVETPRAKQDGIRAFLARALPETIASLEKTRVEPVEAGWSRLIQPPLVEGSQNHDEFLKRMYDAPDDDSVRLVYADWLLEHGDERGEFITLQIQGGDEKRIRALLRAHEPEWLGDALNATLMHTVFRRGFLAEASLAQNASGTPAVWASAAADSRLATVTKLAKGRGSADHYEAFVSGTALRHLRRTNVLRWSFLDVLLERRPRLNGLGLPSIPKGPMLLKVDAVINACGVQDFCIELKEAQLPAFREFMAARTFRDVTIDQLILTPPKWHALIVELWPRIGRSLHLDWDRRHGVITRTPSGPPTIEGDASLDVEALRAALAKQNQ